MTLRFRFYKNPLSYRYKIFNTSEKISLVFIKIFPFRLREIFILTINLTYNVVSPIMAATILTQIHFTLIVLYRTKQN